MNENGQAPAAEGIRAEPPMLHLHQVDGHLVLVRADAILTMRETDEAEDIGIIRPEGWAPTKPFTELTMSGNVRLDVAEPAAMITNAIQLSINLEIGMREGAAASARAQILAPVQLPRNLRNLRNPRGS